MKKVNYLLTVLFAVALLSTSCCKEDPIVPEGAITLAELQGTWISTQYDYNGNPYFNCTDLINAIDVNVKNGDLMQITLVIATDCNLTDNCGGLETNGMDLDYDRNEGKIVLSGGGIYVYKFDVVSYDRETDILVLQLTAENVGGPIIPIGGIYMLQK